MTFGELRRRIGGIFAGRAADGSVRPDGGTSCYRPIKKRGEQVPGGPGEGRAPEQNAPIPYVHSGFTDMNPPMDYGGQGTGFQRQREESMPRSQGNISYMPGVYAPDAGDSWTHVEHIMAMTSLRGCYEAIECMKNGETLIVTLDAIANESENMRCQDMLAGAAFTLGCTVRMIQGGRIVLIAPEGVKVLPEEVPGRPVLGSVPQPAAQGYPSAWETPQAAGWEEAVPVRRERRSSQHAAEWEAARGNNPKPFNPYTGTMPAAAGAYAGFGGFGT